MSGMGNEANKTGKDMCECANVCLHMCVCDCVRVYIFSQIKSTISVYSIPLFRVLMVAASLAVWRA